MNGEWCYFRKYFNKQQCEDILARGLTITPQQAHVGVNGAEGINNQTRRSPIRFMNANDPLFQDVFDGFWKMGLQANRDFFNFHITRLDFVQLAEYDAAELGEYKEHSDVFWMNNDPFYHRKMTALIQLSDPNDYEGGDFELLGLDTYPPRDELREQGTVIFFPSFFLHRANPVTKGKRYSIAAWFEGPKWR